MNKNKFKNKILDLIKEKDISPKPKWHFLVKDYSVWFFGIVSVLVGGVASSVIIFVVINGDWQVYRFLSGSILEHTIKVAPYFWMLFLGIFILIADYNFKHTKSGYRFSVPKVVGLSILASIILGLVFYQIGLAHITDYALSNRLPGYHKFTDIKKDMWNNPEKGLLAGELIPSERSGILILRDFDGNEWEVGVTNLTPFDFDILDNFDTIVFAGSFVEDGKFEACVVKPWIVKGESHFVRDQMFKKMEENGMMPHMLKNNMNLQIPNERNNFWERINKCERGTTSPIILEEFNN